MTRHRFRLINVFADSILSGNALCVFEDGRGLTDEQMQGLALQFNLSETTFLLPSTIATARVRIFTPTFEMPFAGHPTLGSAHVVRTIHGGDAITLEMKSGVVPVTAMGDVWTLRAKAPKARPAEATRAEIAGMLGIDVADVGDHVMWVDTGSEQLMVPLRSPESVSRCKPDPRLLARHASNGARAGLVYIWAMEGADAVVARFFFLKHGSVVEDPGTGSACANLGGWLVTTGGSLPVVHTIRQGEHTGRRCHLGLRVDADKGIFVTGKVIEIGTGEVEIPHSMSRSRSGFSRALLTVVGALTLLSAGFLLLWDAFTRVLPSNTHRLLATLPLLLATVAYLLLQAVRRARAAEWAKATLLATAFLFWAGNQFCRDEAIAMVCNDVAIALFILDVVLLVVGPQPGERAS